MNHSLPLFIAVAFVVTAATAEAQTYHPSSPHDHHSDDFHSSPVHSHDYWHHNFHTPNVAQLDAYADQLAQVARHLHEDAHKLSQDYEHSHSIERYVDGVDRLQQHMHGILHQAVQSGRQSSGLAEHIKSDVRETKSLFQTLYGELEHQGFDGARTQDFYAMSHMRQIIGQQALPLIRNMEIALYGYSLDEQRVQSNRYPTNQPQSNYQPRVQHQQHVQPQSQYRPQVQPKPQYQQSIQRQILREAFNRFGR